MKCPTLINGAIIIAETFVPEHSDIGNHWIVLAMRGVEGAREYVTWRVSADDDDPALGQAYWGNYHGNNIVAAANDYAARIKSTSKQETS